MKPKTYLAVFAILMMFFGTKCGKTPIVSDDLIGVWKTVSPKYAGTFFELTKTSIKFKTKEETVNTYAITKIKSKKEGEEEWTLYTICYVAQEGLEYEFPFYFSPERNGRIRFKNQMDIIWNREREVD